MRCIVAYACGLSLAAVAKRFRVDEDVLYYRFRKFGVVMRSRSEAAMGHAPHGTPTAHARAGITHHLRFLGNKRIDRQGYVVVNVGPSRVRREHVVIAERVLGRPLKDGELAHHVDEVRSNNSNSNLVVCTRAYHVQLHARMRKLWGKHNPFRKEAP